MILCLVLAGCCGLSLGINFWQFIAALQFPLNRRSMVPAATPGVTLLKPLKGCDGGTRGCLESWMTQQYAGPVQILFGVQAADDPVCELVRELIAAHPAVAAQLVICPELLGANAKVSTLAHLEPLICHELLVVSDADVRIPPDLLAQLVLTLDEAGVGLANCFYRLANPSTLPMRWEAVAINADFWSQVLQARTLKPQDFALGAAMATRREQLAAIGGFRALVDYLADDYQLGHQIARRGSRIELCPLVVECWDAPAGWAQVWAHQLRWARTIRACQPGPYFASILSNLTFWAVALAVAVASLPATEPARRFFLWLITAALVWRLVGANLLQRRLDGQFPPLRAAWLPWLKDLFGSVIWAAAFVGNTVEWRGIRYRVGPEGKLTMEPKGDAERN